MKVVATQRGYNGYASLPSLLEEGAVFTIPDSPTRRVTKQDDEITQAAAIDGKVPVAFTSEWMLPIAMAEAEKKRRKKERMVPEMTNIDQAIYVDGMEVAEESEEESEETKNARINDAESV